MTLDEKITHILVIVGAVVPLLSAVSSLLNHIIRVQSAGGKEVSKTLTGFASAVNFAAVNLDKSVQFAKMVEWGMTPIEAIQSATVNAAQALGRSGDVGTLAVGQYGDIIAVAGDPRRDVTELTRVHVVIKGGEVVRDNRAAK